MEPLSSVCRNKSTIRIEIDNKEMRRERETLMKKTLLITCLLVLLISFSVSAQNAENDALTALSVKIQELEARIAALEGIVSQAGYDSAQKNAQTDFTLHGLGEEVNAGDRSAKMESAVVRDGILEVTFVITNTSSQRIEVGGFYSFMAKNDDGVILESDYYTCNSNSLDTSLIPNDTVKGILCFAYEDPAPVKLYYEPDPISEEVYVWQIQP